MRRTGFAADLIERVVRTFIAAFGAALAGGADGLEVHHLGSWQQLGLAALSAGATGVLGLATRKVGKRRDTASILGPSGYQTIDAEPETIGGH